MKKRKRKTWEICFNVAIGITLLTMMLGCPLHAIYGLLFIITYLLMGITWILIGDYDT